MLQIFKNESFGEIRTVTIDGEPWFVGKDVCNALKYTNSRDAIRAHVSPEHVQIARIQTTGGRQNLKVVDKSGFACLITQNRKMTWEQKEEALNSIGLDFQSIGLHFVPDEIRQKTQVANAEIVSHEKFGKIRIIREGKEILFCGKDVAESLGYKNPANAIADWCKGARRVLILRSLNDSLFKSPTGVMFITKGDMYRLIAHSKLPSAEKFESWIFDEIVPEVVETGSYNGNKPREMTDEEILSRAVLVADRTIKALENKNQALEAKIETDRPKVEFAEALLTSDACMTVGDFAKKAHESGIDTTERKLFRWMLENQYLMRRYGRGRGAKGYVPTAKSERMKLFEIDLKTYYAHGKERSSATSLITPKGQEYFIRKLKEQNRKDDRNGILFN